MHIRLALHKLTRVADFVTHRHEWCSVAMHDVSHAYSSTARAAVAYRGEALRTQGTTRSVKRGYQCSTSPARWCARCSTSCCAAWTTCTAIGSSTGTLSPATCWSPARLAATQVRRLFCVESAGGYKPDLHVHASGASSVWRNVSAWCIVLARYVQRTASAASQRAAGAVRCK